MFSISTTTIVWALITIILFGSSLGVYFGIQSPYNDWGLLLLFFSTIPFIQLSENISLDIEKNKSK